MKRLLLLLPLLVFGSFTSFTSVNYAQEISSKPVRNVDSLINDIADYEKAEDYSELLTLLPNLSLFLSLAEPLPEGIPLGQKIEVKHGMVIKLRTASVQSLKLLPVFTSSTNPKLAKAYGEIEGREVLQMVVKMPDIDGLLVQSSGTAWVIVKRDKISDVLSKLPK
jgi:hypothetical protein